MEERWFYLDGQENRGPFSRADMERLAGSGRLRRNDLVWREGTADWIPADRAFPDEAFRAGVAAGAPPRPAPREEPPLRRRETREPPPEDFDDRPHPADVPYPGKLRAAGIIWVVIGALILLFNGISLLIFMMNAPPGAAFGAGVCAGGFVALFGGAFIFVGIQSITGTAPGTIANGIGSIIFGALVLGVGLLAGIGGGNVASLIIAPIEAAVLVLAGVLAIQCDQPYKEWRYVHKPPPRYRPRPRYDDEDDYRRR